MLLASSSSWLFSFVFFYAGLSLCITEKELNPSVLIACCLLLPTRELFSSSLISAICFADASECLTDKVTVVCTSSFSSVWFVSSQVPSKDSSWPLPLSVNSASESASNISPTEADLVSSAGLQVPGKLSPPNSVRFSGADVLLRGNWLFFCLRAHWCH